MPIYEYQCTSCHHHFDLMQKISDPPETQCPQCAHNTAIKLVSAAGFQLKGTGWYATDFKSKGNATQASTNKKDESTKTNETKPKETSTKETSTTPSTTVKGDSE